jgi:hypothetical protein
LRVIRSEKEVALELDRLVKEDGRKYALLESAADLPRGAVDSLLRGRGDPGLLRTAKLVAALGGSLDRVSGLSKSDHGTSESRVLPLSPAEEVLIEQRRTLRYEAKNVLMDGVLTGFATVFGSDRKTTELLFDLLVQLAEPRGWAVTRSSSGQVAVDRDPKASAQRPSTRIAEKKKRAQT